MKSMVQHALGGVRGETTRCSVAYCGAAVLLNQSTECTDGEAMTECSRVIISFLFCLKCAVITNITKIRRSVHCAIYPYCCVYPFILLILGTNNFVNIPELFITAFTLLII
jgi:hypothetical protein